LNQQEQNMDGSLLKTIYQDGPNLYDLVNQLLTDGADPNQITEYQESPLRVASNNGRFDVIQLLLANGADESQLGWSDLFHAIAFGKAEQVANIITDKADLEHRDFWRRTPLLFSVLVGDIMKTKLLISAGIDTHAVGRCGRGILTYAIQTDDVNMLKWLLKQGFDAEQRDDFEETPLIYAAECGSINCVQALIDFGVGIFAENHIPQQAIEVATELPVVQALISAGADINDINDEVRAAILGHQTNTPPDISKAEFKKGYKRVFGNANPQSVNNPFWMAMVKSGGSAYQAISQFVKKVKYNRPDPVWCYQRFGKSITALNDGRYIEIAGEHEDSYDPDFCIYNDVFVHDGKGHCQIFTYPREVFPPTDFHTATLVDDHIFIIGNLGYGEDRRPGHTPVYQLNINSLMISLVKTSGEMPGWISRHKAHFDGASNIIISGGKLIVERDGTEDYIENGQRFSFNIHTSQWAVVR